MIIDFTLNLDRNISDEGVFVGEVVSKRGSSGRFATEVMEKQLFQFGDQETADIKLQVISEDGSGEINVYLHSKVLRKSEFYEAWLSNRWSLEEQPRELKIRRSVSAEIYLGCFQLMYSCEADQRFCFSGVDEALHILPVVSEMLFHDGIEQCMQYLEAVRWCPEQELRLRAMLSSLQINILPELAARIGMSPDKSDSGNLDMLKHTLHDMLSPISCVSNNNLVLPRTEVEKYIVGYFEAAHTSSDKAVVGTCRSALLDEFHDIVERIRIKENSENEEKAHSDWSTLLWLFDVIRRCDDKLYQIFVKSFCEDDNLRDSVRYSMVGVNFKADILLDRILNAMGNGEIITPASFRFFFLTNWLYPMVLLIFKHPMKGEKLAALESGIMNVGDTLPLPTQKFIYNFWKDVFKRLSLDNGNALKWWAPKMQDAIKNGKIIW